MSDIQNQSSLSLITPNSERVDDCAETFRKVISTIAECGSSDESQQESLLAFQNELNEHYERFQMWCSNVGAYERGPNSLDNQLRDHSKLQSRVQKYLEDIQRGLGDIIDIVTGKVTPWDELSVSSEEDDSSQNTKDEETELKQLINFVKNSISCLLRISVIIQNPGPHGRFSNADKVDLSFHQKWDERHVSEKFTSIPEWMVVRLGKANTWRRQFLENRKSHSGKIKNPRSFFDDGTTAVQSVPPEVRSSDQLLYPVDDDGNTVTSYAETVTNDNLLLVPTMPDQAKEGSPFECPFCFKIIGGIHNRIQWKRHVFTDLQPYICLFPNCSSADKTFARRNIWIRHEKHFHRKGWRCSIGCDIDFLSKKEIHNHFADVHDLTDLLEFQVDALSIQAQLVTPAVLSCPLCHEEINGLRQYYIHVSRHLEQLALFVVPNDILNKSSDGKDDDENGSSTVENVSNGSDSNEGKSQDEISVADVFQNNREDNGKPSLTVYPEHDEMSREEERREEDESEEEDSEEEDGEEDNSEEERAQLRKKEDRPEKKKDQSKQKTAHSFKESSSTRSYSSTIAPSSSVSSSFADTKWIWSPAHGDYYQVIYGPDGRIERYKWAREDIEKPRAYSAQSYTSQSSQPAQNPNAYAAATATQGYYTASYARQYPWSQQPQYAQPTHPSQYPPQYAQQAYMSSSAVDTAQPQYAQQAYRSSSAVNTAQPQYAQQAYRSSSAVDTAQHFYTETEVPHYSSLSQSQPSQPSQPSQHSQSSQAPHPSYGR